LLLITVGPFGGGCAAPSGSTAAPKPGRGIAEYRQVAREAHETVAATVKVIEGLGVAPGQTSVSPAALPRFDKALHQLELTSVRARARAEAIISRGQAYFDEWKEHLAGVTNQTEAQAGMERYSRLFEHYERVRKQSSGVREEFRPFMMGLREFRAGLDQPPKPASSESLAPKVQALLVGGRRVLQSLDSVTQALNEAETELRATLASTRTTGGPR
jgi:hypothetical protein